MLLIHSDPFCNNRIDRCFKEAPEVKVRSFVEGLNRTTKVI